MTNLALGVELNDWLYTWNTLLSLSKLIVVLDFDEYIREMTRRSLEWRNPLGKKTYECFRYICTMEKNMLDALDNGGFSNIQSSQPLISTGANPFDASDVESDEEQAAGVHAAAGHSDWIKPGSGHKFPCPMINHDHKNSLH